MSVMQRDALQGYWPTSSKKGGNHGMLLTPQRVGWLLGAERDRQSLPRSDLRVVEYWLEDGVLWRQRRTLEHGQVHPQRLLEGIEDLRWRFYGAESGWVSRWTAAQPPQALEITLSTQRFQGIRRVLPLGQACEEVGTEGRGAHHRVVGNGTVDLAGRQHVAKPPVDAGEHPEADRCLALAATRPCRRTACPEAAETAGYNLVAGDPWRSTLGANPFAGT